MNERNDREMSFGDGRPNHSELEKNLTQVVDRAANRVGERVAKALADLKLKKSA